MYEDTLLAHTRFTANMRRVANLVSLIFSNEGQLKPSSFWTYSGISADLFRAIVVLMHAKLGSYPDWVNALKISFTFSGANDIFKALTQSGYDPSSLEYLRRPLQQFALRRHRIVHYGDLKVAADDVEDWSVADLWQFLHWHIAVIAFLYQFLEIVTEPTDLWSRRYKAAHRALDRHADLGRELVALPKRMKTCIEANDLSGAQAALSELSNRLSEIMQLVKQIEE